VVVSEALDGRHGSNLHGARRLGEAPGRPVRFDFECSEIEAFEGETVAVALLAAGHRVFRTMPNSGNPRGGYCFTGRCADCLVVLDGVANARACVTPVAPGMRVSIQRGHGIWEPAAGE
jgi:sarcosine oxidase subunit alpha